MNLSNIVHKEFKKESNWGYTIEEIMKLAKQLDLPITKEQALKHLDGSFFATSEYKVLYANSDVYSLLKKFCCEENKTSKGE